MEKLPIALQLYSVRDDMSNNFNGTLKRVGEMGYAGVEFAGLFGRDAAETKDLLDSLGLSPVSAHVPFAEMMSDPERVFADYSALGCKYIAVPYLTGEYRPGADGFPKLIEDIRMLGGAAKKRGMQLLYHNHDFEFAKVDGKYGLDMLYDSIPSDLLQTELDTCWISVAGESPIDYIKKYSGRSPLVHLKDFVMKDRKKPSHLYNLIGIKPDESAKPEDENFGFRPVGYGVQDIPAIVSASADAGAKWLVVEQDEPGPDKTPLESAKMSVDYLKSLSL